MYYRVGERLLRLIQLPEPILLNQEDEIPSEPTIINEEKEIPSEPILINHEKEIPSEPILINHEKEIPSEPILDDHQNVDDQDTIETLGVDGMRLYLNFQKTLQKFP